MSYLQMKAADLPDMKSGIISFWIKIAPSAQPPVPKPWPPEWTQKHLENVMVANEVAFPGASYWPVPPSQSGTAHILTRPPGGDEFGMTQVETFRDNLIPLICFGDPDQKYERCTWEKKVIGPPVWVYGNGGVPQTPVAQVPDKDTTKKEDGIVPPSCIGIYKRKLRIILQTKNKAKYTGYAWAQVKSETIHIMTPISCQDVIHNPHPCSEPEGWVDMSTRPSIFPNQFVGWNYRYDDVSMLECAGHPEAFIMDPDVVIADDKWHHVVLSFDFGEDTGGGDPSGSVPPAGGGASPALTEGEGTPAPPPSDDSTSAAIYAEATGPDGDPPLPGTWGQYSGINGEYALAPLGYMLVPLGPNFTYTYAQKAAYGAPFEQNGKYGPANNGKLRSKAKAWLAIDDKSLTGKDLNHAEAWAELEAKEKDGHTGKKLLEELVKDNPHAIFPPNAFLAPFAEIRSEMTTNKTNWERDYRTILGAFNGPAARIDETDEPRQQDYARPKYEFSPGALPTMGHPVAIPAGDMFGSKKDEIDKYNCEGIRFADLHIWANQSLDLDEEQNRRLFLAEFKGEDGKTSLIPATPMKMKERLGRPHIRLRSGGNWMNGYNTGSLGVILLQEGGPDQRSRKQEDGQFEAVGQIDRYRPDPSLEQKEGGAADSGSGGGGSSGGGGGGGGGGGQ